MVRPPFLGARAAGWGHPEGALPIARERRDARARRGRIVRVSVCARGHGALYAGLRRKEGNTEEKGGGESMEETEETKKWKKRKRRKKEETEETRTEGEGDTTNPVWSTRGERDL